MRAKSENAEKWAKRFAEALANPIESKVPPGWFTAFQWTRKLGLSSTRTSAILREGVRCGEIEVRKFRISTGAFKSWPAQHYRRK